jgi:prepilin-type N-terminal cleavage/methylation domain-containing protein
MRKPTPLDPQRRGFTLIELLVVIAIISVLILLGVGAGYKVVDAIRVSNTENAMRTITKVLSVHWKKVIDEANNEDPSPSVKALASTSNISGSGLYDANLARVLWIKFRLAEAFPQSYADIRTPKIYATYAGTGQPWIPTATQRYIKTYSLALPAPPPTGPPHDPTTEGAACLYLALSINRGGVKLNEENMAGFIEDTDGDGVKELIDKWGHALQFYRFATNPPNAELAQLNPRASTSKPNFADPIDPEGLMQQLLTTAQGTATGSPWYSSPQGNIFASLCINPFPPGSPQPYYVPYIVSSGSDEMFGTDDDIFSFRLKVGSQ